VRYVSFKALGKAADDIRCGLEELLGGDPNPRAPRRATGRATRRCLERVLEHAPVLATLRTEDHHRRLAVLLFDRDWVTAMVDAIDDLKQTHRREVARWAPMLLATDELAVVLDACGSLNELVFKLQAPFRGLRDLNGHSPAAMAHLAAQAASVWADVTVETVFLQEQLMHEAVSPRWRHHAGRARLTLEEERRLDAEHAARKLVKRPRAARDPVPDLVAEGLI
jgi:hypothetical protein